MVRKKVTDIVRGDDPKSQRWRSLCSAARMAYETGELRQAETLLARAFELAKSLPESELAVGTTEVGRAAVLLAEGRLQEAKSLVVKVIGKMQSFSDPEHKEILAIALRFYAHALAETGDEREAEKELQRSISLLQGAGEDASVQLTYSLSDLAGLYLTQGRLSEADKTIVRAMNILGAIDDIESPTYVRASMISKLCLPMPKEEMLDAASDGIRRMEYMYGANHPNIARALARYFKALEERGQTHKIEETCLLFRVKGVAKK